MIDGHSTTTQEKILLILDFDNTTINGFSDEKVLNLINNEGLIKEILSEGKDSWATVMQKGFQQIKQDNKTIHHVKDIIENLDYNENFNEVFEYLKQNQNHFETIFISGANTLYLKWFIEKNRLDSVIKNCFALNAIEDDELMIRISDCHKHDCSECNISQCKQKIAREFTQEKQYRNIVFIGDGHNDFCLGKFLMESDYLFPRIDFPLHKLANDPVKKLELSCKVLSWKNGLNIVNYLKKLLTK